jgi:hypothetical protein
MNAQNDVYSPEMLRALARFVELESAEEIRVVSISDLAPNMVLEENIRAQNGLCLLGKGQEISSTTLERLEGFSRVMSADETVRVRIRGDLGRK